MAWQEERRDASKQNLFPFYIFYFLICGRVLFKSKQKYATAYWLWVQAKFLTNLYLTHRKHYFAKEQYSIKYSLSNDCLQLGTMHLNCTIS